MTDKEILAIGMFVLGFITGYFGDLFLWRPRKGRLPRQ